MRDILDPALCQALELNFNPVILLDHDGNILFANRSFLRHPHNDALQAEMKLEAGLKLIKTGLRTTTAVPARYSLQCNGNSVRCMIGRLDLPECGPTVLLSILPVSNSLRITEMTRRMQQMEGETARRIRCEYEAQFIFDHTSDGIALLSSSGYFVRANPALKKLFARGDIAPIGNKLTDLIDFGDLQQRAEHIGKFAEWLPLAQTQTFQATISTADNPHHPVEVCLSPIDKDGHDAIMLVLRDLSDTHRIEEASRHIAELEAALERAKAAERSRTRFLGVLSHEIRTPISAIIATAELLCADNDWTPDQAKLLEMIEQSAENALSQVSNALDLLKREALDDIGAKTEYVLAQIIEDVVQQVNPIALKRSTSIVYSHTGPHGNKVMGYPHLVFRIAQNVLSNAVKFTPGGQVSVTLVETPLLDKSEFELVIKDNGCGISKERLAGIFDSFNTSAKYANIREGAGLGLAIAKRAIDDLGGTIEVTSEVGAGSCFTIKIAQENSPFQQRHISLQRQTRATIPDSDLPASRTVLVVDDQDINREIITKALEKIGMKVIGTNSGEKCLDLAVQKLPDVVLMDLRMPGMTGVEATQKLRRLTGRKTLFIIGMTANLSDTTETECREAGMDGVLEKPLRMQKLIEIVKSVTPRKVSVDSHAAPEAGGTDRN